MPEPPEDAEYVVSEIIAAFLPSPPHVVPPPPIPQGETDEAAVLARHRAFLDACFYPRSDYDAFFHNIPEAEYMGSLRPWIEDLWLIHVPSANPSVHYRMAAIMCACLRHPEHWEFEVDALLRVLHDRRHETLLYTILRQSPANTTHVSPRQSDQEWLKTINDYPLTPAQMNTINDWLILARNLFPIDENKIDALIHQQTIP